MRAVNHPDSCGVTLELHNRGSANRNVRLLDAYTGKTLRRSVDPGETLREHIPVEGTFGWYDLTVDVDGEVGFQRRLAGHVETGDDSMSDPAIGQLA